MGLRVWSRREFFSKKKLKKTGRFTPPPIKTKVNLIFYFITLWSIDKIANRRKIGGYRFERNF